MWCLKVLFTLRLECRDPLGMQNKDIPDKNINATSYVGMFYPNRARLNLKQDNKDIAWCTNITDGKQSLTVTYFLYVLEE